MSFLFKSLLSVIEASQFKTKVRRGRALQPLVGSLEYRRLQSTIQTSAMTLLPPPSEGAAPAAATPAILIPPAIKDQINLKAGTMTLLGSNATPAILVHPAIKDQINLKAGTMTLLGSKSPMIQHGAQPSNVAIGTQSGRTH